ncbi:unnamed protein product [Rotaria sordida]|uniref:G domain-containing protein n=1 Tax=Rotaria sordida TaxID=392033 RepID=A0A815KB59_9BILA|nr:unnamed protein product [Rotaria sordida]
MCLGSFGIIDETIPRQCINDKCRQKFCSKCVNHIRIYNGNNRPFQCMYCLKEYPINCYPEENNILKQQIWNDKVNKYGIERTKHLLTTNCDPKELHFDIDCRRRQLLNLFSTHKRICKQTHANETDTEIENMINQLSNITLHSKSHASNSIELYKMLYRQAISLPDSDDIGSVYIRLCEQLSVDIFNDEFSSIFPNTHKKMNDWMFEQEVGEEFHPKLFHVIDVIEQDIVSQWSNPSVTPSTSIGVIGYTNAGKSSLVNRLLGISSLNDDQAAPIGSMKTTYTALRFDRKEPLIYHSINGNIEIPITLVDIQGHDKNRTSDNNMIEAGNYHNEIRKANCDIYILVTDDDLHDEQKNWISFIKETLKRECILVRSKVDILYLTKIRELSGNCYGKNTREERLQYHTTIMDQIRSQNTIPSNKIYLVSADYQPMSIDADLLLFEHSFDFDSLLTELSFLASNARTSRIHLLAKQTVNRVINTCFRRGYVLNVMKYKIAAGFAAIIPFGDQLPRYLSRDKIREAFGINDDFGQYLLQFNLIIDNGLLQTSVFRKYVKVQEIKKDSKLDAKAIGTAAGYATAVVGTFSDDIVRIAAPTATALSTAGRIVLTAATIVSNKMILFSIYCALLWFLIFNHEGLGFNLEDELNEDAIDSLDDKQQKMNDRSLISNMNNYNYDYANDDWNVYLKREKLDEENAMPFKNLSKGYIKDNSNVYSMCKKINEADAMSFEVLRYDYSKDKSNVYFKGNKVDGADAISFEVLRYDYSKDKSNVYFKSNKVDGADAMSFEVLNYDYSKDKSNVYFSEWKIYGADPISFEVLDYFYSKDKFNVYYQYGKIALADTMSFEVLNKSYARDNLNVYFMYWKLDGADPMSFQVLHGLYGKDISSIYFMYWKIDGADPTSFQILGGGYSKDISNIYFMYWKIHGVDIMSFRVFRNGYAKDISNVYCGSNKMEHASVRSWLRGYARW